MKIVVFGAAGYLGQQFLDHLPGALGSQADIADPHQVAAELDELRPDCVINCAGKTGRPNVDWCEAHKAETVRSNLTGPLILLDECLRRDIHMTQLGSGCIYEGTNGGRGYSESDPPNFSGSFYARTKEQADRILGEFPVLILRIRMVFDGTFSPRNLISKLVHYERVIDVSNSLTFIPDLLVATEALIASRATGLFHVVNPGAISPFEIVQRYKEICDPEHSCSRLPEAELFDVVRAPRSNCILCADKLQSYGVQMLDVREAVDRALHSIKQAKILPG